MKKRGLLFAGLMLAGVTHVQAMPYGYYDARSVAMGNVSVATGGITTAALSNPGMLSVNENDDTFAVLFPAIGVQAVDDGDVIDSIDEFQEIEDQSPSIAGIERQVEILEGLENSSLMLGVTPNAAVLYSGDNYTWGVSLRANATASVNFTDIDLSPVDPDATVQALGVMTTEIGLPIGTDFSVAGMQLSVGIMPKLVNVDGITYSRSISDADVEDAFDEETDLGSFTTLDAGVVLNVLDSVRVGLVAKNLLEETKTIPAQGSISAVDINFDRHLRAGVAFDGGFFTLAADMDLTEIDPIGFESPSKMFSVGAELNTFEVFQLRAGYQTNTASGSNDPDLLSLGVGLWLGFHLDAAVVVGDDSSFGGFVQTGFRF